MEANEELHALLKRAAALMVKSWLPQLPRDHQGGGEREEVRLHGVQLLPGHGPQTSTPAAEVNDARPWAFLTRIDRRPAREQCVISH